MSGRTWGISRLGVTALVCVAAVGCGSSSSHTDTSATASTKTSSGSTKTATAAAKTVDSTQIEQGIEHSLSTPSVKVTSASCPSNITSKVGQKFTCSVKLSNGGTGKVVVTQTGPNHFTYEFENGSVQIPGSSADAAVKKQLAHEGVPNAVVNCPSTVIVKVGTTVTCAVSSSSGKVNGSVTYTFSSANGTVDPSSVKQSS